MHQWSKKVRPKFLAILMIVIICCSLACELEFLLLMLIANNYSPYLECPKNIHNLMVNLKTFWHQNHTSAIELFVFEVFGSVEVELAACHLCSGRTHSLVQILKFAMNCFIAHKIEQLFVWKNRKTALNFVNYQLNVIIVKDVKKVYCWNKITCLSFTRPNQIAKS